MPRTLVFSKPSHNINDPDIHTLYLSTLVNVRAHGLLSKDYGCSADNAFTLNSGQVVHKHSSCTSN